MDIAAFHTDGSSSADISSRIVADHQYFGSGKTGLFKRRAEECGGRLFHAEVRRKEDAVKYSIKKAQTSELRHFLRLSSDAGHGKRTGRGTTPQYHPLLYLKQ